MLRQAYKAYRSIGREMVYEIVISTTRHVTPPVRRLARELSYFLWSAKRINRGGSSFEELVALARVLGAKRLIIVGRGLHGNPGRMFFYSIEGGEAVPILTLWLRGVVFPQKLRSVRKPKSPILVLSTGRCRDTAEDVGEEMAYALNSLYVGCVTEEHVASFREVRLLVIEHVLSNKLAYVIKFVENSQELGLKILVRLVKVRV